ncbi:hypothetical protein [Planomonospora algeriensis]
MSGHHQFDSDDDAVERWFDEHQRTLIEGLGAVLDVESGLREVLLHSHHRILVDDLDTVLDVEAGLAQILPTESSSPAIVSPKPSMDKQGRTDSGQFYRLVDAQARLELRRHSGIVVASYTLTRARALTLILDDANDLANDLARILSSDLDLASSHDLNLRHALPLARNLAGCFNRACTLAYSLADDLALACSLTDDLANTDILIRARAAGFANNLANAEDLAEGLTNGLISAHNLVRSRDLARARAHSLTDALQSARAHSREIVDSFSEWVWKVIGVILGHNLPELPSESIEAFLTDFTASDLRGVVLNKISLGGVRWSETGTLWPGTVDVEDLKARSEEVPEEPGVYVIRSDSATERDFANLT